MPDTLAAAIAARFPHAHCVADAHGLRIELESEGAPFRARVQVSTQTRVAVSLPSTDGFELALRWTDREVAGTRAAAFDDTCLVETNDVSLAGVWLDGESRRALLASRLMSGTPNALRTTTPMLLDGTWHHELRSDEVSAHTEGEANAERIGDMLAACLALATRPVRWARWFGPLAKSLGGEAAARVELGGRPVLRVRRGTTDVTVRLLRRLGPADQGRLRTVVGAHRVGSAGEMLTLIAEDLPRAAWPPANDIGPSTLRIDERARTLLDAARPATTIVRRHDVEITFDGPFADADRLGAAIELADYWASDRRHGGPYR